MTITSAHLRAILRLLRQAYECLDDARKLYRMAAEEEKVRDLEILIERLETEHYKACQLLSLALAAGQ